MTINSRVPLVVAMAMFAVVVAAPSFAQPGVVPQQGAPGEAGRQIPGTGTQTLNVSMSLAAAYDSDLSVERLTATKYVPGPQVGTSSNQIFGNGQYQWRARDVQLRADGASVWIHDRRSGRVNGLNHAATSNLTARLPRRLTLLVDQAMTLTGPPLYSLFPLYNLSPGVAATDGRAARSGALDYGADDVHTYSYAARATIEQSLTRRNSLNVSATGERGQTVRRNITEGGSELVAIGMSSRFTRLTTRNTRATVRYAFRAGRFPDLSVPTTTAIGLGSGLRLAEQTVEIGLTYGRRLSVTRRMLFDVVLGEVVLSPLDRPLTGPPQLTDSYRMVGQANATYVFGRTWQAGATFSRKIDNVQGLAVPVLTDGFSGRLEGAFNHRVTMQAGAAYAGGSSALLRGGADFDTYTGDVKLNLKMGRAVETYLQYLYYLYDFRRFGALMEGIPPVLERNGVRVGLTLSVPTLDW